MKIVQFANGQYGIRKYWFWGWFFVDLKNPYTFEWVRGTIYFSNCMGDLAKVKEVYFMLTGKYRIVKASEYKP